jgi:hypothetical protein
MWDRVRLSEQPKLITKERQVSSIEPSCKRLKNSSCNFGFGDFS